MNSRIEELRDRARAYANATEGDHQLLFEEEFSRLIITYCQQICTSLKDDYRKAGEIQNIDNEGQAKALFIASAEIGALSLVW